ncbi:zinc-binding dehydrogenase [Nocardia sp. NPDC004711]
MKAVVCSAGKLEVTDVPDPRPGPGQVLINVSRCGICGSDLHARVHSDELADMAATVGYHQMPRHEDKVVFGHEFCGEVVEYGRDTRRRWKPGTPVVAMPMCRNGKDVQIIGTSTQVPGGYAEQIVVQESMTFAVPNGLPAAHAALTEPMAVAWHAVRRSRIGKKQNAYVIGCGPIGLAVIAMLKAAGVRSVVASDYSPRRRELAARCGADVVVDPRDSDPFSSSPYPNRLTNVPDLLNLGFDTMEKLRRVPNVPWWYAFRAAHTLNITPSGPIVFECVGVPGMIDRLLTSVPMMSRLIVVGACLEADTFHPGMAINKEIDIRFSTGYDPGEFRDTLHMLADGAVDPAPLITGTVGLSGVDAAFTALGNPEEHAKILVDPASAATLP